MHKLILFIAMITSPVFALQLSDLAVKNTVECTMRSYSGFVFHSCKCLGDTMTVKEKFIKYLTDMGGVSYAIVKGELVCYNFPRETIEAMAFGFKLKGIK